MLRSRWSTLAVLSVAQFMVVLDVTIVNVALPDIRAGLGFSAEDLQWVISAYTLLFGGFLLLGGRAADLLGRRRLFIAGLAIFGIASLAAGLSWSPGSLIAARAVQGLGGALLSPAALSILTVTFAHGRERNIAMGVWGALAGLGGTLGVVAGGVIVDALGWEWVFIVNVPVALAVVAITPLIVRESRAPEAARGFDLAGALLGTAGVLALVFGVIRAEPLGWGDPEVLGLFAGAAALLAAFIAVEARVASPLVPLRLFRSRGLTTASLGLGLNGSAFLGMFFLTAIFLQGVRGESALSAGLEFLPMGIAAIAGATVASALVTRIGTRPVFVSGSLFNVVALWMISRAGADGSYLTELMPGFILFGFGITQVAVSNQIAAIAEVRHEEAGAASGVVTAAFQIGGALGLAVITTLANSRTVDAVAHGASQSSALVEGFQHGLVIAAVMAAANLLVALASPRIAPTAEQLAEAAAAA
ncbi:MAG TPA: MFS transporter [Solirubrobacteraceae bacterium]|nr:MFS transporter [Solirubrobacteraceae bacterium]